MTANCPLGQVLRPQVGYSDRPSWHGMDWHVHCTQPVRLNQNIRGFTNVLGQVWCSNQAATLISCSFTLLVGIVAPVCSGIVTDSVM